MLFLRLLILPGCLKICLRLEASSPPVHESDVLSASVSPQPYTALCHNLPAAVLEIHSSWKFPVAVFQSTKLKNVYMSNKSQ